MIQFSNICPGCRKLSLVDVKTPCHNRFNDGRVCGFTLTTSYASGNHSFREKYIKHVNPPPSGSTVEHSWSRSGLLEEHLTAAYCSGVLRYDVGNHYFCLTGPIGSGEAQVSYSGSVQAAWYTVVPLNSKLPKMHLQYRTSLSGLIPIAEGDFVVGLSKIRVSGVELKKYCVWQSGHVVAEFDPRASGLVIY